MSSFLANLVRRGAGVAPTVESRPVPAAADPGGASPEPELDADAAAPGAAAPHGAPVAAQAVTQLAPTPGPREVPVQPLLSRPIAETAAPLVQRIVMPITPAPAVAPAGPIHAAAPSSLGSIPRAVDPAGLNEDPPVLPAAATSVDRSAPSMDTHAVFSAPVSSREFNEGPGPSAPMTPDLRGIDRVVTNTHIIETTRDAGRPPTAEPGSSPAPLAPAVHRPAPEMAGPPERVVQVRIGVIEIHGAPPAVATPPAAPSQPAMVSPSSDGGFDRYARLRSYAPTEW